VPDLQGFAPQQQVKDEPRVKWVILLPPPNQPPDLCAVANEHAVAESLDWLDEPGGLTAGLSADDYFARESGVEVAEFIRLMIQLGELDRTANCIVAANSLLTRVEVIFPIDSHWHLLRGFMCEVSLPQLTSEMEMPASSHHYRLRSF
jgi:hypothetical protein